VEITADVGPVFKLYVPAGYDCLGAEGHAASWHPKYIGDFATFNLTCGGSEAREFTFANLSGAEIEWSAASSVPWVQVEPAAGKLAAGVRTFVKITSTPPDKTQSRLETTLTITEKAGPAKQEAKLVTHVIPPYQAPALPQGAAVDLKDVPKDRVKAHKSRAYWYGTSIKSRQDYGPRFGGGYSECGQSEPTSLTGGVCQETAYNLEGSGFKAFSAKVEIDKAHAKPSPGGEHKAKVDFEVWVDGVLKAQSGLMTGADERRLLVVTGLETAKELRLYVRFDRPEGPSMKNLIMHWHEAKFYK
jgi:hypothetical protein